MEGPTDWSIPRPGFFAQNLGGPYRQDVREDSRIYLPAGHARVAFLDVRDLGKIAVMIVAAPDGHLGRAWTLTGLQSPSFDGVAQVLSKELGRPIHYEVASVVGYLRPLRRQRCLGWGKALPYSWLHVGLRWGEGDRPTQDLADFLGRPPRTVRDYVRDHRALWL